VTIRTGSLSAVELIERIDEAEARFEALEPSIHAFLPEDGRFDRLRREARALSDRYPDPASRPPLFGLLVGVKDMFHVDGWPTRAGSRLPSAVLQGAEAESVSRLKAAGALMLGKTVTTEFAHFTPGPTRNPHNTAHTPGGSSSGSAAAVAARCCELALGTQTIGSIIRPASFCGVVGLKPSYDRISTRGVIPLAPSLDHVGCLAVDVETVTRAARVLYTTWRPASPSSGPVLGIPEGPYLELVAADTARWFDGVCLFLVDAGYELRRVPVMADYRSLSQRNEIIHAGEAARTHASWFRDHEPLYGSRIADLITRGQAVTSEALKSALAGQTAFRLDLSRLMDEQNIDAWVCPSALGPAPLGIESTGDPAMNLPWTHAGFPVVGLPAGTHPTTGLPMGLQVVGNWQRDELLLGHAEALQQVAGYL
jgi:Asp-tRNA(Asn)/Glu-tRNA(Gln) amidotransferase A subunit family amidase